MSWDAAQMGHLHLLGTGLAILWAPGPLEACPWVHGRLDLVLSCRHNFLWEWGLGQSWGVGSSREMGGCPHLPLGPHLTGVRL